jgi:transcriptional regulator with XRE-family HTH domain
MNKNLQKFGKTMYELRIKKGITLREMCRKVNYDPSNLSKIERGKIAPPADKKTLEVWARALGIKKGSKEKDDLYFRQMWPRG